MRHSRLVARARWVLASATLVPLLLVAWVALPAGAEDQPLPHALTHQHYNGYQVAPATPGAHTGESQYKNPPSPICTTTTSAAANVNTDCDATAPHNETSIAVNPTDTSNMIGGANDYQLNLSSGGTINETIFTRAHVTFDGGRTWSEYPIRYNGYTATGDPSAAFDDAGNAYMATLGFGFSQGGPTGKNPDILVAHSTDQGRHWTTVRVAKGTGSFGSVGRFNDKEYLTAWGDGNAIVTWTVFHDGKGGSYINSPIYDSVTHDGGNTWSPPQEISGSAPFCVGSNGGDACDQDQGSIPTVAADGSVYVAFLSTRETQNFSDQYVVVKVDPQTGARIGGPYKVADVVDGINDYPVNIQGRQTYQDSQFRTWSAGNITADPTDADHLAVVWSDMRNTPHPVPSDPYQATTNSDVIVSQSFDGGKTWSAPQAIAQPGDQFMPWGAYDTNGLLRIGYFDRSYDPANHEYGYTLATESAPGSLTFTTAQVTTELSQPTTGDRWFAATVNPDFPFATTFIGDYGNIAANPAGGVVAYWTDMRNQACFTSRCGHGEDAYFASMP